MSTPKSRQQQKQMLSSIHSRSSKKRQMLTRNPPSEERKRDDDIIRHESIQLNIDESDANLYRTMPKPGSRGYYTERNGPS